MTISRMGISSLMGYRDGGGVDLAEIGKNDETVLNTAPPQQGLASMLQLYSDVAIPDVQERATEYRNILSPLAVQPSRPSFYDLASELGKGLLAQQQEKFSSIGRGVAFGFTSFSDKEKAKRKAYEKEARALALKATELALGDVREGKNNFTKLLSDQIIKTYDPDIGTAVELVKVNDDGSKDYKTLGSKQVSEINKLNGLGYNKVTSGGLTVNTGDTGGSGLEDYFKDAGKNLATNDAEYDKDLKLANDSDLLLQLYREKIAPLPDSAFGIVPSNLVPIRNIMTSIPGLQGLVDKNAIGTLESINNLTINLAMMTVQKTKGPISDTEMRLFIGSIPSMAQTKAGVYNTLDLMSKLNSQIIAFSDARATAKDQIIRQAIADGDNASTVGDKLVKWEIEWRKNNPVFSEEENAFINENFIQAQKDPDLKSMGDYAIDKVLTNTVFPTKKESKTSVNVEDMSDEELQEYIESLQ
jgi:hypothetical protein